jgi:hypothetical protein
MDVDLPAARGAPNLTQRGNANTPLSKECENRGVQAHLAGLCS